MGVYRNNYIILNIILIYYHIIYVYTAVNITNYGYVYKNSELIPDNTIHEISLTFVTTKHNGLLFYGNNDLSFFSMELYYGSVRISGNFSTQRTTMPYVGYVGYGLADGQPHQIEMYKRSHELMVVTDRGTNKVNTFIVSSDFLDHSINFGRIYIGNHPDLQYFDNFQSITKTNFVGCIEEATWNSLNILGDEYFDLTIPMCNKPNKYKTITFLNMDSFVMMYRDNKAADGLNIQFDLLIYQNITTIIRHIVNQTNFELVIIEGKLQITLYINNNIVINAITVNKIVNDGNWHNVRIYIPGKSSTNSNVIFAVDDFLVDSPSPVFYNAGKNIQFGGYGFIGCIENIKLDNKSYILEKQFKRKGISTSGCNITFQCNPNPCVHGGKCIALEKLDYSCICNGNTTGLNCEKPISPPTCAEIHKRGYKRDGPNIIDADGVGLFDPIWVNCYHMNSFDSDRVVTVVKPVVSVYNLIDSPKSWEIEYNVSSELLSILTTHSSYCKQTVTYQCTRSKITDGNITLMNWVGADTKVHEYWNSLGVYGKCECAIKNNTCVNNQNCNCDNYDTISRVDRAELGFKTHLPIIRINAMNISSMLGSSAKVEIGDFFCQGIGGKLQLVTFQEVYAYLSTNSLNLWNAGSFELDFKTDQARGNIILYSRGRTSHDFVLLYLRNPTTVSVEVNLGTYTHRADVGMGSGVRSNFENNKFHSITFEISRHGFTLTVDGNSVFKPLANNIFSGILLNLDNLPTYIGGTPFDPFSGFRGTIRDFRINGQPQALFDLAMNESIVGIVPGLFSACISVANPCNAGKCSEHYNYYVCDCDYSPYYGSQCQNEKGISVRGGDFAISYNFVKGLVFKKWFITIGFVTTNANATLFSLLSDNDDVFYVGNMVNGVFGMYYHFRDDISFQYRTFIIEKDNLGYFLNDNRLHIINVDFRKQKIHVNIDNKLFIEDIEEYTTEPATFQQPSTFYVGGSTFTTSSASESIGYDIYPFQGCISGCKLMYTAEGAYNKVLVDPVLLYYKGASGVQLGQIAKNKCGKHNFTMGGNAPLIPYPPNPVSGDTSSVERRIPLGDSWGSTLLGLSIFLFTLIILIVIFLLKWWSRNIGTYQTDEGDIAKTGNVFGRSHFDQDNSSNSDQCLIGSDNVDTHKTETGYI